jgi:hypothetical protein
MLFIGVKEVIRLVPSSQCSFAFQKCYFVISHRIGGDHLEALIVFLHQLGDLEEGNALVAGHRQTENAYSILLFSHREDDFFVFLAVSRTQFFVASPL